jgi:hypothetical protein
MENVKHHLKIINQFFEIEKKLAALNAGESVRRNVERIKRYFEEMGYQIHNPIGESYSETRTDCEASIAGTSAENLYINEVIKPIVRYLQEGQHQIIQKGIVITKSR